MACRFLALCSALNHFSLFPWFLLSEISRFSRMYPIYCLERDRQTDMFSVLNGLFSLWFDNQESINQLKVVCLLSLVSVMLRHRVPGIGSWPLTFDLALTFTFKTDSHVKTHAHTHKHALTHARTHTSSHTQHTHTHTNTYTRMNTLKYSHADTNTPSCCF